MRKKELMEKTQEELLVEKDKLQKELRDLRFKKVTGVLENPLKIRTIRRDIARINTLVYMRELDKIAEE